MPRDDRFPQVLDSAAAVRRRLDDERRDGRRVALVPTMGALHEGHLRLVDEARARGDLVIVSIFVNPTQFGPGEDLESYPRDLARDLALLAPRGADLVFAPRVDEMYPENHSTTVRVAGLTAGLCGAHRAGHFDGVATIVTKLLNIVGPCVAVFGRKDYQQLQVIQRLAVDLDLPVEIVGVPTVREADGLALSSRNAYLSDAERGRALALARGLTAAHRRYRDGARAAGILRAAAREPITAACDSVDYVTVADPHSLAPLDDRAPVGDTVLIAVAARVGATRLIDNTVIGEDPPPLNLEGETEQ